MGIGAEPNERRMTIDFQELGDEIDRFSDDPEWHELKFASRVRALVRRGLNKTPFSHEFVKQAVKFALGRKAVQAIEEYRKDKTWQQMPIDDKVARLVEIGMNLNPCSVAQVVQIYWDLLIAEEVEISVKRLSDLRRGEGDRLSEEEVEAIAAIVPLSKDELLGMG